MLKQDIEEIKNTIYKLQVQLAELEQHEIVENNIDRFYDGYVESAVPPVAGCNPDWSLKNFDNWDKNVKDNF